MPEIFGEPAGSLVTLLRGLLFVYPFLTLPVLVLLFVRPREGDGTSHQVASSPQFVATNFSGEEWQPPGRGAPSEPAVPASPVRAAAVSQPRESLPHAGSRPASAPPRSEKLGVGSDLTLERLLEVLESARVIEARDESPEPVGPAPGPVRPPAGPTSRTRITEAELEALTAPPAPGDAREAAGAHGGAREASAGASAPSALRTLSGPSGARVSSAEVEPPRRGRPNLTLVPDASGDRPRPRAASDRRTLASARRVAENPRMKRWIRDIAEDLLAKTGT